jgi:hypothetical protein
MSGANAAPRTAVGRDRPRSGSAALGLALLLGAGGLSLGGSLLAAVPTLTAMSPNALNPATGTPVPVKFTGKLDGTARRVWCDDPAITFTLPDASGNATATVALEAAPGLHLVRFVNAEGATLPIRFAVGPLPRVEEKEPNDEVAAPQSVPTLPAWIQGRLEKAGDVDGFALTLKKGVPVFCKADGYTLGSPVDLHMHLLDQRGTKLATASDGRNLDPELTFTPPEDGVYLLQVAGFGHPPAADVNFTGSALCAYQIAVTAAPVVQWVFPAALPAEGKAPVELLGQGLPSGAPKVELSATGTPGYPDLGTVFPKGALAPLPVVRTRHPIKSMPEASLEKPAVCAPPCVTGGRLAAPGASAVYRIPMKKGERLQARFWSRSIRLGLDGDLLVKNPAGEQVAANANPADVFQEPTVVWTAAVDGDHTLVVRDLFQKGGPGAEFVLEIAAPAPAYTVEIADGKPVRLDAGKTLVLKAKATFLNGWKEPLLVRLAGLPEGVFAPEVAVPEKGGDFDITLHAASNAPAATAVAWASVWTKATPPVLVGTVYPLRGELRRGTSESDFARDLWVTVGPPAAMPAAPAPKK